eukprot:9095473-Alexandrium_andersonii.AAC.1
MPATSLLEPGFWPPSVTSVPSLPPVLPVFKPLALPPAALPELPAWDSAASPPLLPSSPGPAPITLSLPESTMP